MFTSKAHLHQNLGVDERIAKFFVDRKVPQNNRYWAGRYLYVAGGTGYLFIPLFFDLQFRSGVGLESLLDEEYLGLMEAILHSAALHESNEISFGQHIGNCNNIMEGRIRNRDLYQDLLEYFKNEQLVPYKNLGTYSKALSRGDSFLFSLCYLDLDRDRTNKILDNWYSLVPSFLLMDDVSDLQEDTENNEENSINEIGKGSRGVTNAIGFLREKFNCLKHYNAPLGIYFEQSLERKIQSPYLQSLLNDQG